MPQDPEDQIEDMRQRAAAAQDSVRQERRRTADEIRSGAREATAPESPPRVNEEWGPDSNLAYEDRLRRAGADPLPDDPGIFFKGDVTPEVMRVGQREDGLVHYFLLGPNGASRHLKLLPEDAERFDTQTGTN
jgi:hypothetical protein